MGNADDHENESRGEGAANGQGHGKLTIHVDRKPFKVAHGSLTGAQLRALPDPDIGPDRGLYLVVPGPGEDRLIGDSDFVELDEGMHFYSAPRTIDPGHGASS